MKYECKDLSDLTKGASAIHGQIAIALHKSANNLGDDAAYRLDKVADECEVLAAQCRDAASKLRPE